MTKRYTKAQIAKARAEFKQRTTDAVKHMEMLTECVTTPAARRAAQQALQDFTSIVARDRVPFDVFIEQAKEMGLVWDDHK